ncbi:MAG: SPASM domain-containing protein [Acidobacteriaceae bacterium]
MPPSGRYCTAGIHGFILLPDGQVTVCERLIDGRLIVGDLRSESIAEMWNSPSWARICAPDQALYQETACFNCSDYSTCTQERRRCFISTLFAYNRFFGSDSRCPRAATRTGAPLAAQVASANPLLHRSRTVRQETGHYKSTKE